MKTCTGCNTEKEDSKFPKGGRRCNACIYARKKGRQPPFGWCYRCRTTQPSELMGGRICQPCLDREAQGLRMCSRCHVVKPLTEFNKNKFACRDCTRASDRAYIARPDIRYERAQRTADWRDASSGAAQTWWLYVARRKAAGLDPIGGPVVTVAGLIALYGHICPYCQDEMDLAAERYASRSVTVDHVIGVLEPEGSHGFENCLAVCSSCNRQKHAKSLTEYLGDERAAEIRHMMEDARPRFEDAARFAW